MDCTTRLVDDASTHTHNWLHNEIRLRKLSVTYSDFVYKAVLFPRLCVTRWGIRHVGDLPVPLSKALQRQVSCYKGELLYVKYLVGRPRNKEINPLRRMDKYQPSGTLLPTI
ncbi:uncharacterized protein FFM5_11307 [Fusarium fujikuroi]|nr:uncharacterized protein FFM5_11307 [Fusarium fujikuroi]